MPNRIKSAVLIDLSNITGAMEIIKKNRGLPRAMHLNFSRLVRDVSIGTKIIQKKIYLPTPEETPGSKKFIAYLEKDKFTLIMKPIKKIYDRGLEVASKANFDVEIAVDAMNIACDENNLCNEITLFSGDSDFAYLIKQLQEMRIQVNVVSSNGTLSRELREVAQKIILLDTLNINDIAFVAKTKDTA